MPEIILLRFNEPAGVQPSDELGNLGDLQTDAGLDSPEVVEAWTGRGRAFTQGATSGLVAEDASDKGTILQRDATIVALLSLTLDGAGGPQTVIARGLNDGSVSERYCYGLELEQSATAGLVEVRWFHQDGAGVIQTMPAGVFEHAGDGAEFMLTATRRWESSAKVVVRYYVNDQLVAEIESAAGDISGGTLGHTSVGARKAGGVWGRHLNGTIDELLVADYEMSPEGVREIWRRLSIHQPAGVEMFAGLVPPGLPWVKNPGNNVGRFAKLTGLSLGGAIASAEEMRSLWLPDGATREQIARWERICGLNAKPRDSLDKRRARVLAYLSREEGFSHPAVKATLATPLDLEAAHIEIDEFENTVADDFDALEAERWHAEPAAAWSLTAPSRLSVVVSDTVDLRYATQRLGYHMRTPIIADHGPVYASTELAASELAVDAGAGILLVNRRTGSAIWFGIYRDAVDVRLRYRTMVAGVLGPIVNIAAAAIGATYWLRLTVKVTGLGFVSSANSRDVTFAYSTVGPSTGFASSTATIAVGDLEWAGLAAFGESAATATESTCDFESFVVHCPNGVRPFHWYAYRDPALAGAPDMIGGRLTVAKIKPAHTHASAIQSRSVLCDDAEIGLCDHGPMGGL